MLKLDTDFKVLENCYIVFAFQCLLALVEVFLMNWMINYQVLISNLISI